jgi:hypothetical protein
MDAMHTHTVSNMLRPPCSLLSPTPTSPCCHAGTLFKLTTVPDGASGASLSKGTCSRQSSTRILCSIGPGSGKHLVWRVVVGPDVFVSVAPLVLSFTPPVITGVSGAERMPTMGGSAVTITGTSFGPLPSIVVFYGPVRDPMRYTATNCTLLATDTTLRCLRYVHCWSRLSLPSLCYLFESPVCVFHTACLYAALLALVVHCNGASLLPTTSVLCTQRWPLGQAQPTCHRTCHLRS